MLTMFDIIDITNAPEEAIKASIEKNCKTAETLRIEIKKLKEVAEKAKQAKKEVIEEEKPVIEKYVTNEIDEDFEDEVEYYYSLFSKLTRENLQDDYYQTIPVKRNYRYKEILYRMKASIIKNIKEIKDFIANEDLSITDLQDFQEELSFEREKMAVLDSLINEKEDEKSSEEIRENKLIFVPSYNGNIHIFDDIDQTPQEYYEKLNGLFQSIKDGTFKGVKRFKNDVYLNGLCEVKEYKTRVVFVRLSYDTYAVLTAFVKKTTRDNGYLARLRNRAAEFYNAEESLKANLKDEKFIKLNADYEQQLLSKLLPEQKTTSPQFIKKGGK